jgi:hypothetical protein
MPYWISSMLAATPAVAWVFFGLGVPWALVALPRKDWHDRALVIALAFALGPMLLTAWMFILGAVVITSTLLLRLDVILAGTMVLAAIALVIVWRKARRESVAYPSRALLTWDERLLIGLIAVALLIRWFGTAYWPFTAYDALWVFGYEGRLYTLLGYIPPHIAYYPQFLPLQYTYAQLAVGGINDHAARAVIPFLHVGSILAVYILGSRLLSRRTAIMAAALWALYPHVAEWSRFGDLEIPVTFLFTLAAAFFLMAWSGQELCRRYAIIAGLILGTGLWTKPTMGAFIWGVLLLCACELWRQRFNWRAAWPRLQLALITALAAVPLGGVWYLRNIMLGHNAVDFPTAFWLTQAARSGAEFGWPLLAILALLAYLYVGPHTSRPDARRGVMGLALVLAGLVPSIITPHRMGALEWLALSAGAVVLFLTLRHHLIARWTEPQHSTATTLAWGLVLALPYFITWFYSYSYHYRLSFTIVPLMLLPTAAILAGWLSSERLQRLRRPPRAAYFGVILVASIPGIIAPLYDPNAGWKWLWEDGMENDFYRYQSGNGALMSVVQGLQAHLDTRDDPLVVVAPGIVRLPFFFPLADIRTDTAPTRLSELSGVTYFVYGTPESGGAYRDIPWQQNQIVSALSLAGDHNDEQAIMRHAWWHNDGTFRYDVYELRLENRFVRPYTHNTAQGEVIFGGFARFLGHDIGNNIFGPGYRFVVHLYFEVLTPPSEDYTVYIHLRQRADHETVWSAWDGPVTNTEDGRYYSTLLWEPGEFISEQRVLELQNPDAPVGDDYVLVIGMYNLQTGARVPVTIDGQPAGDGFRLYEQLTVVSDASD